MEIFIKIDVKNDIQNPNHIPDFIPDFIPEAAESYWDDIEIQPVKEIEKGIFTIVEEGEEDFWSVYLHQLEGGLKCIADVRTKITAKKLAKLIWNAAIYRVYLKSSKLNF